MNMIPYHHIDKPDYLIIQFKSIKNVLMIENYCADPDCECNEVMLNFAQLNESHQISNSLLNLTIDINTGTIKEKTILEPSLDADAIIFDFHEHFYQFKNHLMNHQQKVKQYYKEFHGDELPKDILSLINSNNCVDYQKIFGDINQITINHDQETYIIEDQYCMKPSCLCNEVILVIYKPNALTSEFVIRLDLETDKYEILKFNNSKTDLIDHMIDTKKSVLKARYNRMKMVGKQFLEQPKPVEKPKQKPLTLKKVGRNELCPCGSGKKYKKCCG